MDSGCNRRGDIRGNKADLSFHRVLEWLAACGFPAWVGVELKEELTIEWSVEELVSKRVKRPASFLAVKFDAFPVPTDGALLCWKVEFDAAPVLIPIRYEELSVLWNMKASHNSNEETTVLFVPHAVFQGFI